MADIRALLEAAAPNAAPLDLDSVERGALHRRRRRRGIAGLTVVVAAALIGTAILARPDGGESNLAATRDVAAGQATVPTSAIEGPEPTSPSDVGTFLDRCTFSLRTNRVPGGWDGELKPGAGGEGADPAAIGHWTGGLGRYVNVLGPDNGSLPVLTRGTPSAGETIEVLGRGSVLEEIHEGFGVAVTVPDDPPCGFALTGYGITPVQLRALAEGLYAAAADGRPTFDPRGAFWPEATTTEVGVSAKALVEGDDAWRVAAEETAIRYGRALFRTQQVTLDGDGGEPSEDGRFGHVLGVKSGEYSAVVKVARAVGHRWYSVYEAIVPFQPFTSSSDDPRCPDVVDVSGRRWVAEQALPTGLVEDASSRLHLMARDRAELRSGAGRFPLRPAGDDSGAVCG